MMPFALLVLVRLAVSAFFLLTCAYAVLNCSPFAFDMFIKPQLIPWLTRFVAWHHVWFAVAYVASVAALAPALSSRARHGSARAAHWLALGYVVCHGPDGGRPPGFAFSPDAVERRTRTANRTRVAGAARVAGGHRPSGLARSDSRGGVRIRAHDRTSPAAGGVRGHSSLRLGGPCHSSVRSRRRAGERPCVDVDGDLDARAGCGGVFVRVRHACGRHRDCRANGQRRGGSSSA